MQSYNHAHHARIEEWQHRMEIPHERIPAQTLSAVGLHESMQYNVVENVRQCHVLSQPLAKVRSETRSKTRPQHSL